jgi:hypothetical protein
MPTNTYVELRTETVTGSPTSSVTFNLAGISGYTDLVAIINGTTTANADTIIQFNGATTNYSSRSIVGNGTSATSVFFGAGSSVIGNPTGIYLDSINTGTGRFQYIVNIMNYANTNTFKTVVSRFGAAATGTEATVGLYRSTSAITSITFAVPGTTFTVGSTFSLYGIAAEGTTPAPKATGGAIYSDSLYYYHAFGATGIFRPNTSLTADVLVVAGGGGSGAGFGTGGGGAGGVLGYTSQSLASATNYTCTIGGGGAGSTNAAVAGTNGTNSSFTGLTAATGGGGGASSNAGGGTPGNGGSGGGATAASSVVGTGIAGPPRQGYNGTSGGITGGGSYGGGGAGGGAGAIGTAGTQSGTIASGGTGGNGSTVYSDWVTATGVGQVVANVGYIAGGGGGGAFGSPATQGQGGFGGGGAGGFNSTVNTGLTGLVNTGGGAGGSALGAGGAAGGSGVVIIRYLKA